LWLPQQMESTTLVDAGQPALSWDLLLNEVFPWVVGVLGLPAVGTVRCVCRRVNDYAQTSIKFWMKWLETNRARFVEERVNFPTFMHCHYWRKYWPRLSKPRWRHERARFAAFLHEHYVLVPEQILHEGGPIAVVQSKRIVKPWKGDVFVGNTWGQLSDCDGWQNCVAICHFFSENPLAQLAALGYKVFPPHLEVYGTLVWTTGIFEGKLTPAGDWVTTRGPPVTFARCYRPWSRYFVEHFWAHNGLAEMNEGAVEDDEEEEDDDHEVDR
jgi:hypothetical protein